MKKKIAASILILTVLCINFSYTTSTIPQKQNHLTISTMIAKADPGDPESDIPDQSNEIITNSPSETTSIWQRIVDLLFN